MASGKTLSKSETAAHLAEKAGITKKQAQMVIEAQADLAYKQARNTFVRKHWSNVRQDSSP